VVLTAASQITPEQLRWLWDRRVALRGLSLIAGEPGLGKSTLTVEVTADVTHGRLEGDLYGEPRDVLIATAEDHFASVVWGRLTAAGADMDRVHRVHVDGPDGEELLTLPDDVAQVERRCEELAAEGRPVALVAVDPVTAFIGGGVDTHRDAAVRRVLAPLAGLAERQQLAVVGVAHLNKDTAGKLLSRVGGSVAFGAAPRSVLAFARHPDDPDGEQGSRRVIVQAKSNHGRFAPSLAAKIEARVIPEVGEVSRLVIEGECDVSSDDLGAQGGEHHERDAAADWLADELADGGWVGSRQIKASAKAEGHSERTIQRAKLRLGVEDRREGYPAVSEWRLPVAPRSGGATENGLLGATTQTRMAEPHTSPSPISRAMSPGAGATDANGWTPEQSAAFIRRAKETFPEAHEVPA
jgi:RecA-family ATPase